MWMTVFINDLGLFPKFSTTSYVINIAFVQSYLIYKAPRIIYWYSIYFFFHHATDRHSPERYKTNKLISIKLQC